MIILKQNLPKMNLAMEANATDRVTVSDFVGMGLKGRHGLLSKTSNFVIMCPVLITSLVGLAVRFSLRRMTTISGKYY